MPEQENQFPQRFELNGIDYFLLQLDHIMLQRSGWHNVCTFVVSLDQVLCYDSLLQALSANAAYQWLCRLRLRTGLPFSKAQWVYDAAAEMPLVKQYELTEAEELPECLLATEIRVKRQAPFKIDLLQQGENRSTLLFTWHHALMDARGGELFIQHLGDDISAAQPDCFAPAAVEQGLLQRLNVARNMKQFLYEVSALPLQALYRNAVKPAILHYRLLRFTAQQLSLINTRASEHGAGFLSSAFYLAACACAVAHVQQMRGQAQADMLIPVPQDRRRRGATGPLFGNQVAFLFYRIPQAMLSDISACTQELIKQMKSLMRADNPSQYLTMMNVLRHIPGPVYRHLMSSPTQGLMGSFFYSDTGDSLQSLQELFACPVGSAVHYPPNVCPPGLTFVFSKFRGGLQISLGYMEQVLNAQEADVLEQQLQRLLLGEHEQTLNAL